MNIERVVSGKVNSLFVKRLAKERGWTKQDCANLIMEFLYSGTEENFKNWMESQ